MARPPQDVFQIGWICALPIEAAAAAEMLDEEFGILEEQDAADLNTYTLGRIGHHYIVIACLPGGQYGTTSATSVAINMLRTFSRSLRIGLMVGIGGGIPSDDHRIRLGDIVISYPQGNCGGVIQYDMGKIITEGKFEKTGSLNSPPRALLAAVSAMSAACIRDPPRYPEYLQKGIGRTSRTRRNFGQPDPQTDRFFQTKYDHPLDKSSCDDCPVEWEETRDKREDNEPQPHYGIIASGNKVIKHGLTRDSLHLGTGALCFEMEAAGLMLDFPCIVIRGICDYADSHKNKAWQGYAALAAAAYAKELLGYVPSGHVSQESLIADTCKGLRTELQATNQRLDQAYSQQKEHHREKVAFALTDQQNRCHQVFKTSPYEQQKNNNPRKEEGTCIWALQSPEYIRWLDSDCNDLLWISADPGCGKSVLARSIIDNLKTSASGVTICYFFFKDNSEQNSLSLALCSVLHQLFSQQPELLRHAIPSWGKNGERLRQEVDELWRIFTTAVASDELCNIICIFDALDECCGVDQNRLVEKLRSIHGLPPVQRNWLKFLITSRPYDHIQDYFQKGPDLFPHLHLKGEEENDQIHQEIDIVVKMRVKQLAEKAELSWDIQQKLEQRLLQMKHRTYLWLHLAIDDIETTFEESLRPTVESIQVIPQSVDEAYEKILNRVPPRQTDVARRILQIIVAARRPLTTLEMAMALGIAISPEVRRAPDAGLEPSKIVKKLRRLCGLFVFISDSKIYLIHQTAREFLLRKDGSNSIGDLYSWTLTEAENQMTAICVRYLLMNDVVDDDDASMSCNRNLLEYAALYWADHRRQASLTQDQRVASEVQQMYDLDRKGFSSWFPIFSASKHLDGKPSSMRALNLASFNGHEWEVKSLLSLDRDDIDSIDGTGNTPLFYASKNGYLRVVELLLEGGAEVNAPTGIYSSALYGASSCGHTAIVRLLIENGADVNIHDRYDGTVLQGACFPGNEETVQLLLDKGAEVNASVGQIGTALQTACSCGIPEIVQLLLDKGAEVNAPAGQNGTALQGACYFGSYETVQLLLEKGAEVNAPAGPNGNALQGACFFGSYETVQLLLEKGAEVNAPAGRIGTALHGACLFGSYETVQLLLEKGAEVNVAAGPYRTALQNACSRETPEIVQLLLDKGAEVNAQAGRYMSALQTACSCGTPEIVQLLLDKGAEVNALGGRNGTPLQSACSSGSYETVQLLLDKGAEVNALSKLNRTALQIACLSERYEIVQLLLEKGAEVNAPGSLGNALQVACSWGTPEIVQLLLDKGAEVNAPAGPEGTALQVAIDNQQKEIVKILMDSGAVDER